MTVKELREALAPLPDDMPVYTYNGDAEFDVLPPGDSWYPKGALKFT